MTSRYLLAALAGSLLLTSCGEPDPESRYYGSDAAAIAEADRIAAEAWAASGRPGSLPEAEVTRLDCRDDLGSSLELEYFRLDEDPAARDAVDAVRRHWDGTPLREAFEGNSVITYSQIEGFNARAEWTGGEMGLRIGLATTECYPDLDAADGG